MGLREADRKWQDFVRVEDLEFSFYKPEATIASDEHVAPQLVTQKNANIEYTSRLCFTCPQ